MTARARRCRWLVPVVVACLAGGAAAETAKKPEATVLLERAIAGEKEPGQLEKALAELDALAAKQARDPDVHYARGWVLSHLGRGDEAVVAYDRAFELAPTLADAAYNAGVVHGRAGRPREAAAHFDKALGANPRHVDAAYNAGQAYYDAAMYPKAAERWQKAAALAPNDFQTAKKLVQAYVALDDARMTARARDTVFALRRASRDPAIAKLSSYVYDQFDVGTHHIFVHEAFDPKAFVFQFTVTENDRTLGSITFEPRAGGGFALALDRAGKRSVLATSWKERPDYKLLKAEATRAISASF
ncbi:MAG: tetratricopeptide repeat protein [Deltaproteobacteria bacterium]|nr:tetratricopeptide repeat protein [Deltaproteobacteria bacterium]